MNKDDILAYFNQLYTLNEEQKLYLTVHAKRFEAIFNWLGKKDFTQVLDVGPSFLSELLYRSFGKNLTLLGFDCNDSLGGHLADDAIIKKTNFITQDLNSWNANETKERFDLIVCGEVLEHLYTSPNLLLGNFYKILNTEGYLIIQTPNAASLRKRLCLLFGQNPYDIPRENLKNPGHFREYTSKELSQIAEKAGFEIDKLILDEYFEYPSLTSKIYRKFKNIVPPSFRSGITIILKKK